MKFKRDYESTFFSDYKQEMNLSEYIKFINQKVFQSLKEKVPSNLNPKFNQYKQIRFMRSKLLTTVDLKGCLNTPLIINFNYKVIPTVPNLRLQILISLILSPQTKDEMTFQAFENLFKDSMHYNAMEGVSFKYLMTKTEPEIDSLISKVGFHKRKAKAIKDLSLLQNDGDIPLDYDSLISLNGVGPKIAMLTLQNALGEVNGIGVDTHVNRFASKFEWIENSKSGRKPLKNAEITRKLLQKDEEDGGGLSKKLWAEFNLLLVGFGQEICTSTKLPKCNICLVKNCKDRRIEIDPSLNIIKDIEDLDIGVDIKNNHVEEWLNFCKEKYNLVARDKDEDILGDWDVKFSNLNKEIHGVPLLIKEENKEEKESFKRIKIDVKIEDEEMNVITKRTIKQEYL